MLNKEPKISNSVVRRLPIYLRLLQSLSHSGVQTVSSQELGIRLDVNPAQIRKDLAYFGEFGRKGVGYDVKYLENKLRQILNLDQHIHVALVGAGHLGVALCNYARFQRERIEIRALFDNDPKKVGTRVNELAVLDVQHIAQVCADKNIHMGIIAVPAPAAQDVCDALVDAGIRVILNFAPANLRVPRGVRLRNADVTSELQSLAFYVMA